MKKALEMDPDNMGAVETNLKLMGQRAVEAQQRLAQLKRSLQEVSSQKVELFGGGSSVKTVRELAMATEDANARAADAKRNYAELDHQLGAIKKEISSISGFDLSEEANVPEAVESLRQLGLISDELADKYQRLNARWKDAFDENEVAKAVAGVRDLSVEVTKADAEAKSIAGRFSELSRASHGIDFGEGIDEQLRRIDAAAESVNDEIRRLDSALKVDGSDVQATALKMRDLQEASTLAERRAELLQQKLERMDAAGIDRVAADTKDAALAAQMAADEYDKASAAVTEMRGNLADLRSQQSLLSAKDASGTDEYRGLASQISAAEKQLERLVATQREASVALDTSRQAGEYRDLQVEISEARAQQSKLNDEMQQMGRFTGVTQGSLVSLGMSLSTTVTPAMVALGHGMIESANDIDAAYRDMRKTVNGTEEDFESLRQAAIEFSSTNVTSADQILSIQAIGGELGVATDDLKTFAETVSNLDVATNLDAEEAATALGQLSNIISDLTGDKFPNFADALVRLGNNGASTESAIADVASRIGAMGSIVGMTTPEILAWSSTIASTGQGSEAAGTAISRTMSDIETAVANGGEALDAFAEIAGMSADEFATAWQTAPSEAMQAFIEGLVSVEEGGGSAITTLDSLGITAVRQVQSIQGLMQMIEGLDDNLEMSRDAWNGVSDEWGEAGDAAREAERKAEGFSGALSRLQNMAQNVGAELGDSLVPVIDGVADVLGTLYDWFVDLPDGAKQMVVAIGGVSAALGPLLLLGKGVNEFFGGISDGIKGLRSFRQAERYVEGFSSVAEAATTTAGGLAGALKGLAIGGAVGLAIGGITTLVGWLEDEAEKAENARRASEGLSEACGVADESMAEAADSAQSLGDRLDELEERNDETDESLARLADEFDELNAQTAGTLYQLGSARDAIEELGGRNDLTAEQVGTLKGAVQDLNAACGTNFEVVREADGSYQIYRDGVLQTKDAIYDLIDAQQLQVQLDAQMQKRADLYEDRADAANKYADALEVQAEAQKEYDDAVAAAENTDNPGVRGNVRIKKDQLDDANIALAEAETKLNNIDDDINDVDRSIGNLSGTMEGAYEGFDALVRGSTEVQNAIGNDEDVLNDFADALEASGVPIERFSNLSTSELINIAQRWSQTGGSITGIMRELGISTSDAAGRIQSALSSLSSDEANAALEGFGIDLYSLSEAMAQAGLDAGSLADVSSEDFARMAASCGGSIDALVWMIENYNNVPVEDKDGSIVVNDAQLRDAQGNVYTWNGTTLVNKDGVAVVDDTRLVDAQGNVYTWNGSELVPLETEATADVSSLEYGLDILSRWNRAAASAKNASVTIKTTRINRTVNTTETQGAASARSLSEPVSVPVPSSAMPSALSASASGLAAAGLARTARDLSSDPLAFSEMARSVVASYESDASQVASALRGATKAIGSAGSSQPQVTAGDVAVAVRDAIEQLGIYLDTGKLVGGITPQMNRSLGRTQKRGSLSS